MPITLPKQKQKAESISPDILMLYGVPKVGKTSSLVQLENNLIIDLEDGTKRYDAMAISAQTYGEMQEVLVALATEHKDNGGKPVYTYITIDTLDVLEDIAKHKAAEMYKDTPMGKKWYDNNYKSPGVIAKGGEDIYSLPNGAAYGYIREAMKWYISVLKKFCKHVILVAHVKDKKLAAMGGVDEIITKDISLTGRLGSILAAQADAIGYMFRLPDGTLRVSFKTGESAVMGSRCPHLAGQVMDFDWNKIYVD